MTENEGLGELTDFGLTIATSIKADDTEKFKYSKPGEGDFLAVFGGKIARVALERIKE